MGDWEPIVVQQQIFISDARRQSESSEIVVRTGNGLVPTSLVNSSS